MLAAKPCIGLAGVFFFASGAGYEQFMLWGGELIDFSIALNLTVAKVTALNPTLGPVMWNL